MSDLFTVSVALLFIINEKYQNIYIKFKDEIIFLLLFYIYININSIFISDNFIVSAKVTIPYFRYFFFLLFTTLILINFNYLKKIIFYSFYLMLFILLLDSLYQTINGQNILGYTIVNGRISSFFADELIMGSVTIKFLIIILSLVNILGIDLKKKKFYEIFIFLISFILVLLSSERTAFIHFFVITLSYSFIRLNFKKFLASILILIIFNTLLIVSNPKLYNRIIFHTINQIDSSSAIIAPSYRHELHYFTAWNIFKNNILFGKGVKSFRFNCDKSEYSVFKKIIKDKAIYAPQDSRLEINDEGLVLLNPDSNKVVFTLKNFKNKIDNKVNFSKKLAAPQYVKKGDYLGSYSEFSNGCNTHPHHTHLQILSSLGVIGYLFLIYFIYYLFKDLSLLIKKKSKNIKTNKIEIGRFICSIGLLLSVNPVLPSGSFFNNYNSIIFFFNLSIFMYLKYYKKNK